MTTVANQRIIAFDIGIKNLAWCCLTKQENTFHILGWDNYNLLSESSNLSVSTKKKCNNCSAKAVYETEVGAVCSRHCPATKPALRDVSGALLKKVPKVAECKAILQGLPVPLKKLPVKKEDVEKELAKVFSLPLSIQKVSKAPDAGLTEIHTSIQKLVQANTILWSGASVILLENQPAFKNPTMKSVQILLFATLRDLLQQPPPLLKLVHAGKKVQGAEKGDAGYKDRKAGSEARVEAFLRDSTLAESDKWKNVWTKAVKKSDLADALCMCIDAIPGLVSTDSTL
jgi:hypothetical protein